MKPQRLCRLCRNEVPDDTGPALCAPHRVDMENRAYDEEAEADYDRAAFFRGGLQMPRAPRLSLGRGRR